MCSGRPSLHALMQVFGHTMSHTWHYGICSKRREESPKICHNLVTSDGLKGKILVYNLITQDPWLLNFHGSYLQHVLTPWSHTIPRHQ